MYGVTEIMKFLPHRYPFLLVDRILELEPGKRIVGLKNVTINEPFFQGHFPGAPVMPGVLIIEAMAQVAGVMIYRDLPDREKKLVYFTGIENAKFRRPVVPGDQLRIEMEVLNRRSNFGKMQGRATVDGKLVAEAVVLFAIADHPGSRPMKVHPTAIIHPQAQVAAQRDRGPLLRHRGERRAGRGVRSDVARGDRRAHADRANETASFPTPPSAWPART